MPLPRLHLFEIEDQPWCPAAIRDLATDYLHFLEARLELHRPVVPLLGQALRETGAGRVVDLCSGGGGPIPALQRALAGEGVAVPFILTDRFPNREAFERLSNVAPDRISFSAEPVDARAVPPALTGLRTMFNAFHHFRPADASAVLADAVRQREPIAIFEIPDRRLMTLIPGFFLIPLLVALVTPFIRPFRWSRLLWTYLVPLVPLVSWWDGFVSQLRAYTTAELLGLAEAASGSSYVWRAERIPIGNSPGYLTYLIGRPSQEEPVAG